MCVKWKGEIKPRKETKMIGMRKFVFVLGLLAALAVVCVVKPAKSEAESQDQGKEKSKAYLVYPAEGSLLESYIFQPVERVNVCGIDCVGGVVARAGYWCSGKRVYIPVDKVRVIVEFSSLEEHENALKEYTEQQRRRIDDYYRLKR